MPQCSSAISLTFEAASRFLLLQCLGFFHRAKHCARYMLSAFLIEFAIRCRCFVGYLYPGGHRPELQPLSFAYSNSTPQIFSTDEPWICPIRFYISSRSLHVLFTHILLCILMVITGRAGTFCREYCVFHYMSALFGFIFVLLECVRMKEAIGASIEYDFDPLDL